MIPYLDQPSLTAFGELCHGFLNEHTLTSFATGPIDHVAVKLANTAEYEQFVATIKPESTQLSYTPLNGRRIATAVLRVAVQVGPLGATSLLEIMEPRPEKAGRDYVGLEHIEIVASDLALIRNALIERGLPYEDGENDFHKTVVVKVSPAGQEIKWSNRPLGVLIQHEFEAGLAVRL